MVFACAGGCRRGRGGDNAVLVNCRYCSVILSKEGEDEGCWAGGQVIHGAKCKGAKHRD